VVNSDRKVLSRLYLNKENFDVVGDFGADPNFRSPKGAVAAVYAASHDNIKYLQLLVDAGLNPDIKHSNTPVIFKAIGAVIG